MILNFFIAVSVFFSCSSWYLLGKLRSYEKKQKDNIDRAIHLIEAVDIRLSMVENMIDNVEASHKIYTDDIEKMIRDFQKSTKLIASKPLLPIKAKKK